MRNSTYYVIRMAKVRIRAGRAGGFIWVDSDATKWTGAEFKEFQAASKAAATKSGIKYVTVGRGTGKIKFDEIQSTPAKKTKGMWVSSGRGTGKRKL